MKKKKPSWKLNRSRMNFSADLCIAEAQESLSLTKKKKGSEKGPALGLVNW